MACKQMLTKSHISFADHVCLAPRNSELDFLHLFMQVNQQLTANIVQHVVPLPCKRPSTLVNTELSGSARDPCAATPIAFPSVQRSRTSIVNQLNGGSRHFCLQPAPIISTDICADLGSFAKDLQQWQGWIAPKRHS